MSSRPSLLPVDGTAGAESDVCDPPRKLEVTMWEQDGEEGAVVAELTTDGLYPLDDPLD